MYDLQKPRGKYRWMKVGKTWNETVRHPEYLTLTAALSCLFLTTLHLPALGTFSPEYLCSCKILFPYLKHQWTSSTAKSKYPNRRKASNHYTHLMKTFYHSFTTERVWGIKVFIKYRTRLFKRLKGNYIYGEKKILENQKDIDFILFSSQDW